MSGGRHLRELGALGYEKLVEALESICPGGRSQLEGAMCITHAHTRLMSLSAFCDRRITSEVCLARTTELEALCGPFSFLPVGAP